MERCAAGCVSLSTNDATIASPLPKLQIRRSKHWRLSDEWDRSVTFLICARKSCFQVVRKVSHTFPEPLQPTVSLYRVYTSELIAYWGQFSIFIPHHPISVMPTGWRSSSLQFFPPSTTPLKLNKLLLMWQWTNKTFYTRGLLQDFEWKKNWRKNFPQAMCYDLTLT